MSVLFRFIDWPLRAKMAALLVIASLLPLILSAFNDIRDERQRVLANAEALLAARGDQLVADLDVFHREYQRAAGRLALFPRYIEFCLASPREAERLKPRVFASLKVQVKSDPALLDAAVLDTSGTVRIATQDQFVGKNLARHNHVREALRGVAATSDIYLDETSGVPTIAYLAPVFGPDRTLIGLTALWVRATALRDLAKVLNGLAGPNSFAVVFDRHGIRVAHTYNEDIVFHPGGPLARSTVDAFVAERRFGEKTRALLEDVRAFPEQFDRARSDSPDKDMFRGFAPVNNKWNYGVGRRLEAVPWTAFYMIPEESLEAQIAQMTRRKISFAGMIIFFALVAGMLFATVILKPIGSLSKATESLAGGNLATRVAAGSADELGQLGMRFNIMAERMEAQANALRTARDDLELRVQERTAELEQTARNLGVEIVERRAIVESALDGIINMNHEGRIVEFNPAAEHIFGHRRGDVIGKTLADVIIPPALREQHTRGLEHYLASGEGPVLGKRVELPGLRADGSTIPIELSITRMPSAGAPMFTGFLRDITERKHAEQALRESEQNLATTLNSIADAVIATDMEGRVLRMNPLAELLTGWPLEQARGRTLAEVFHIVNEDTREVMENPVVRVLREGVVVGVANHTVLVCRDGSERPIADSGAPIRDPDGKIHGVVLVFRDQTEEYKVEQMRFKSLQLEVQSARIREANRMKSEFLANMSHELRTPLNGIIGFSEFLVDEKPGPLNARQKEYLGYVLNGGLHLLQLINDVLDLSKVESGKMELFPETFSLPQAVEDACAVVSPLAKKKNVTIHSEVAPEAGHITLDQQKFKQVLYNLLSNAVKFTDDGGQVRITAGLHGPNLRLQVRDTGIGIKAEDIKKLFVEFQQIDSGLARRYEGTGLGLALTKKIVEFQHGSITVESEPGTGSTFTVILPLTTATQAAA